MFTQAMLTIVVALITVRTRVACVKGGQVNPGYFSLMRGENIPDAIVKTTRCYNNLFEIPMLFYVACTLHLLLQSESLAGLLVAWLFVACRCAQAYIHITYNNVMHRMYSFGASVVCVVVLWLQLLATG